MLTAIREKSEASIMYTRLKPDKHLPRKPVIVGFIIFLVANSASIIILNNTFVTVSQASPENEGWTVTLNFIEEGGAKDSVIFGQASDASDSIDDHDMPKPPTPQPPYLRAWFTTNLDPPYNTLWEDYRPYPSDYNAWNLSLRWIPENDSSTNVTISWDISQVADTGYSSALLISDAEIEVDMMTDNHYTFTAPPMTPHNFQIICQSETPTNGNSDTNEANSLLPLFLIIIVVIVIVIFVLYWWKIKK